MAEHTPDPDVVEEDRIMMLNPTRWPMWPMLPLKLRNAPWSSNEGVLVDVAPLTDKYPESFGFAPKNMYEVRTGDITRRGGPDLIDELLAEGWYID